MRVAAIYDIHGNVPALEAVLDDIRLARVDQIVVGGDVVPGPMPCEALDRLAKLEIPLQYIMGNGDRETLARMAGTETEWCRTAPDQWRAPVRWSAAQLRSHHRRTIEGWPATCRLKIEALGEVLFCHATPRNDTDVFTRTTPDGPLKPIFESAGAPMVVCGHTHMQFDRMVGSVRVLNAGSVGMPYAEPGAYWLLLGPSVELRRTPYDLQVAAERIRSTPYPQAAEFALNHVLRPPTEKQMLEIFGRIALS